MAGEPVLPWMIHGPSSGRSPDALKRAARSGRLVRVRRGWYVEAERWALDDDNLPAQRNRLRIAAAAAVLAHRHSLASHLSGAVLAGLPLWPPTPTDPCVTLPRLGDKNMPGMHTHRALVPAAHLEDGAIRTTSIARTILDIAREHGFRKAVVAGDYALAAGLTTRAELQEVSEQCWRFPGIVRARAVIDLLDARAESPLESMSRLKIADLPFPAPSHHQVDIYDEFDTFLGRADDYWEGLGMVGEADGRIKYEGADATEVLVKEKRRAELFRGAGLAVARWGSAELRGPGLLQELERARAIALARPPGGRRWRAVPRGDRDTPAVRPRRDLYLDL